MKIIDRILFRDDKTPVPDGTTVQIRMMSDNSLIGTTTTTDGYFTYDDDGYPGAVYWIAQVGDEIKTHSSLSSGPAQGVQIAELQELLSIVRDGIVDGVDGELVVTAVGTGLQVSIAAGAAAVDGLIYRQYGPRVVSFVPAGPYSAELNYYPVVVRFHFAGSATPWKTELLALSNSIGNNVPPVGCIDLQIASVRIDPAASSLTPSDVTSETLRAGDITAADVVGFDDAVYAKVADILTAGAGITLTPNAGTQKVAIAAALDAEGVRDTVAAFLKPGANVTVTHNDAADTLTIAGTMDAEAIRDTIASFIVAGAGVAVAHNDAANTLTISLTGTAIQVTHDDDNYAATGSLSGSRTLGTAQISLAAGTWFIEGRTDLTARNDGNAGTFVVTLNGNGAPVAPDDSARSFRTVGGVDRLITLSGRRQITLGATTLVSVGAYVYHESGDYSNMRSGVVYMVATKVG